jgi:putative tryptophan/tyrosine transport system substrate-binding protein
MRRREFIAGLGSAATWSTVARAQQQPSRMRTLALLSGAAESDQNNRGWLSVFDAALQSYGWIDGQNIRIERRYTRGGVNGMREYAKELIDLKPDLVLVTNTPSAMAILEVTHQIPVLFVNVTDPVGSGIVSSLSNPGGNATGFTNFEFSMGGKWLQILKEVAPDIKRTAIIFNPEVAPFSDGYIRTFRAGAESLSVDAILAPIHDVDQLERLLVAQTREPGGSIIVMPDAFTIPNRNLIIDFAVRHRLPSIYPYRVFALAGGLISYGPDIEDLYRRAAAYADRLLRGATPSGLPVQQPNKFEFVINNKTAKAIGLTIPDLLLARADEVIE